MILGTILVRKGSKGVPGKNKKIIAGKPLIQWSLEQMRAANIFDHIVVSSDDVDILEFCEKWGVDACLVRPEGLANDKASKVEALKDCVSSYESQIDQEFDIIIDLDVTSPLREAIDIENSLKLFKSKQATNIITGMASRRSPYFNMAEEQEDGKVKLSKPRTDNIVRRQDAPATYDMNASIYVWDRSALEEAQGVFLEKTFLYEMPEERSFDIDSPLDFKIVEMLLKEKNE